MSKSVLDSVRQAIDDKEDRARRRVKSARKVIADLPNLIRERRQLRKWRKRARSLRQRDLIFVTKLSPAFDDVDELLNQSIFLRGKGKLQDLVTEAHRQFREKNPKSKCGISMLLSSCSFELRGGLTIDLPAEAWQPLLGEGGE